MSLTISLVVPADGGGVRDYADILVRGLNRAGHRARVLPWQENDAGAIDSHIATSDCVYLQYSGYGFSRRGAPLWMLHYLKERRSLIKRFGVFFHELYAFGPPWGSAFWLTMVQRHVAASLAQMSDFWLTSREDSKQWLSRHAGAVPNETLPVFSNVGELTAYSPSRDFNAVVFGSGALRRKTWQSVSKDIFKWANHNGLLLHDIGPRLVDSRVEDLLQSNGVIRHGRLEADAISQLLITARFGILAYPVEYAAKSGVLAAYCAHGVTPILASKQSLAYDGLIEFDQYFPYSHLLKKDIRNFEFIGERAFDWYKSHSIENHLRHFIKLIEQPC